jgi:hypothetical protein
MSGTLLQISNDHARQIAKVVQGVNDLYSWTKLDKPGLIHWANEIDRLAPDLDPMKLKFLIDCFKANVIEYNQKEGIQAIFKGLEQIDGELGDYKKRSFTW